jgi:hypothetical protein
MPNIDRFVLTSARIDPQPPAGCAYTWIFRTRRYPDSLLAISLNMIASVASDSVAWSQDPRDNVAAGVVSLDWQSLPNLPNDLGLAGPFVGVHNDVLTVAGGANFPRPVWDDSTQNVWHDRIYVMTKTASMCSAADDRMATTFSF